MKSAAQFCLSLKILLILATVVNGQAENMSSPVTEPPPCDTHICVRKCCPAETILRSGEGCSPIGSNLSEWTPTFPTDVNDEDVFILHGFPDTPSEEANCISHDEHEYELLETGEVFLIERKMPIAADYYCIDNSVSDDGNISVIAGLCYEPLQRSQFSEVTRQIQMATQLLSCIFLLILLGIHVFTPTLRSTINGKCFLSMCLALLLGLICLSAVMFPDVFTVAPKTCIGFALGVQYFLLAFSFWLNTRCYETLRIIRGTVNAIPLQHLNTGGHRFLKYSLYSWGTPFIVATVTIIMQMLPEGSPAFENLKPQIGNGRCFIRDGFWPLAIYYYGYQVILHALNVLFMGFSAYLLWTTGEAFQCMCCKKSEKAIHMIVHNKKSLKMFWQQFYIFLLFIGFLSLDSMSLINSSQDFWKVIDIINSLQGMFLFIIFIQTNKKQKLMISLWSNTSSIVNTLSRRLSFMKSWNPSTDISTSTDITQGYSFKQCGTEFDSTPNPYYSHHFKKTNLH